MKQWMSSMGPRADLKMFDEAAEELADALARNKQAMPYADAKEAITGGDLMAENVIKQEATVEEFEGEKYVTAVDGKCSRFSIAARVEATPDADPDREEESDSEAAEEAAAPSASGEAAEPSATLSAAAGSSGTSLNAQEGSMQTYVIGDGLEIDVDPVRQLAGEPSGQEIMGARQLTNGHPDIAETSVPYYPADPGKQDERDTEDLFFRALGLHIPVILEGEAGSGKNQLADSASERLVLPKYRQEFGADTSVFDVVGEKDLVDGRSYYILGKLAKAMIFGGIYIADEINMAGGNVTSYLHPAFEAKGKRELELRGTGITLRDLPEGEEWDADKHLGRYIHPDFYPVATMNPPHYADTQELNGALRSRCLVMEHPYLADSERNTAGVQREAELLSEATGADTSDVIDLVRTAAVLREARRVSNDITCPIGFRELRDTVQMAGPNEEFMSFKAAAMVKMVGQAELKQDKQYIEDAIEEEL